MSSQIQDGAHYYILNIVGSLVLDLDHGNSSSGTPVKGWTPYFDHVATNRVWQFKKRDNWWEVQNVQGGTVLTLKNGSSDNGTPIFGEYSFGGDRQLWRFDRSAKSSQVTYWT